MEVFESKIDELIDLRDGFFEKYPNGTEAERVKTVRERALLLLEDVPLSGFPRSAVRYLQKQSSQLALEAVTLDPSSGLAHCCLGNSLFLEFFNTGQVNEDLLVSLSRFHIPFRRRRLI
ncbi:hypothetical protein COOONC_14112 [Cooperia oncophora]